MAAQRSDPDSAPALLGNQWVLQVRAEHDRADRADRAEATLHATQVEATDIMLRATETAEALLVFAQDAGLQVVRTAQEKAESVLALAQETAEQLLKEAERDGRLAPPGTVSVPSPEVGQQAESVLEESQAAALTELRLRQAIAIEALETARATASRILQVGQTQTGTD